MIFFMQAQLAEGGKMAEEKFDKVILVIEGEPLKELTFEGFKALPLDKRVDMLVKNQLSFFKNGQSISPMDALKFSSGN
jgi:hypothetical protein